MGTVKRSKSVAFLFVWLTTNLIITEAAAQETDPYTVELYNNYCKACHSVKETGAPQSFSPDDWHERLAKGRKTIINNAIVGIGNMPALGGCQECSYEDYEDLIDFMSSKKSQ